MTHIWICLLTLLFSMSGPAMEENADFRHSTLAAENTVPSVIYRGGGKNPGSLTPRAVDEGMLSTRDSLSNPWPLAPGQKPTFPFGGPYQVIDTAKLLPGTVIRDGAPFGGSSRFRVGKGLKGAKRRSL